MTAPPISRAFGYPAFHARRCRPGKIRKYRLIRHHPFISE
jgi:hypothetical protein